MATTSARIDRIFKIYGQQAAVLQTEKQLRTEPGQYLAMLTGEVEPPIPLTGFVLDQEKLEIQITPIPVGWLPGEVIHVRGGLGKGFHLPEDARKIALVSLDEHPARLMYQLSAAHRNNLEILLICNDFSDEEMISPLPPAVEVLPFSDLSEAIQWADIVDLDCPRDLLPEVREFHPIIYEKSRKSLVEILISTQMPCLGIANCGVCAVHTREGYPLACKDGPVFRFEELVF